MIEAIKRNNFIGLAEHGGGHGYFILPVEEDFAIDNFTVSLRIGEGHGYFILPIFIVEIERIILNKYPVLSTG